jgi:hypothetical protein
MIDRYDPTSEIWTLLDAACGGTITACQVEQLETILRADERACDLYMEYFQMYAEIFRLMRLERCHANILGWIRQPCEVVPAAVIHPDSDACDLTLGTTSPTLGFLSTVLHSPLNYVSSGWPVAYLIATVICGIGALVAGFTYVSRPVQLASKSPAITRGHVASEAQAEFVGQITGMVDCKWVNPRTAPVMKTVSLEQTFVFASGLMEITYDTGAKVILQGPITYKVDSQSGGFLAMGKLTAKMVKKVEASNPQSLIPH